jgi:4-hydroxy-tetrahydrodipicolinate synthase
VFEGISTALVTPFREGAIDEAALRALIERQIEAGVDTLVPCGSTGESATMSHDEHVHVIEVTVDAAAGRVAVLAGTGSNNTREAVDLTRRAKTAGASGALLISPYYNKPTQPGIVAHYTEIAQEGGLPLVVYNVPGRTGSNILPGTLAELAEVENIVGVKEACGDICQIAEVIDQCPEGFAVLSGDDAMTLPLLALGGHGVISTSSNVAPVEMTQLVRAGRKDDLHTTRQIHYRLMPLFDVLFCETNPIPLKTALSQMGFMEAEIRLPLTDLTEPSRVKLSAVLKDLGFL